MDWKRKPCSEASPSKCSRTSDSHDSTCQQRQETAALRISSRLMSLVGLGRVKTFSCKRSEREEVATRAVFPDFDYALIAAISG